MDCENCIFAELNDSDIQVGCSASRLDKYIKLDLAHQAEDSNFYKLSKLCNMKRDQDWLETICLNPKYHQYNALEIATREVEPTFGIVIYDDSHNPDDINTTLNKIKDIEYHKNKYVIIWSIHETVMRKRTTAIIDAVKLVQNMKADGYKIWLNIHKVLLDIPTRDRECFSKVIHMSHLVKIAHGVHIPKSIFNDVNSSINDKLESKVLFENKSQTVSIVPTKVAQLRYLDYNDYDLMVNGIRDEAQKGNLYVELYET
jgi:hypothetical protein